MSTASGTVQLSRYDAEFFQRMDSSARSSADVIVPLLMELLNPRCVIDVGCGRGEWLARFQLSGVERILGLDGPWVEHSQLAIPTADFRVTQLEQPWQIDERFDVCCCLEVAEHLPHRSADALIANLTAASDAIVFSAAVPGQQGTNHINEQWPQYWEEKYKQAGFLKLDVIRPRIWQRPDVAWYYQQNMYLYLREEFLRSRPDLLDLYERSRACQLTLIHPKVLRPMTNLRAALRLLPRLAAAAWRRRWQRDS